MNASQRCSLVSSSATVTIWTKSNEMLDLLIRWISHDFVGGGGGGGWGGGCSIDSLKDGMSPKWFYEHILYACMRSDNYETVSSKRSTKMDNLQTYNFAQSWCMTLT